MSITYRLKRDIVSRTAANLVFDISEAKSVHIIKNERGGLGSGCGYKPERCL